MTRTWREREMAQQGCISDKIGQHDIHMLGEIFDLRAKCEELEAELARTKVEIDLLKLDDKQKLLDSLIDSNEKLQAYLNRKRT